MRKLIKGLSRGIGDALVWAATNGKLDIIKYLMETGMKNEKINRRVIK